MSHSQTNFTAAAMPRRSNVSAVLVVVSAPEPELELVVPEGSIDVVLTWVGSSTARAAAALAAERSKPHPRKRLIKMLTEMTK